MSTSIVDHLPPQNTGAEEALLGSLLMDADSISLVAGDLEAADFYRERNGAIYSAMLSLRRRGEPVDVVTLTDELQRTGRYEEVGGLVYVSALVGVVPTHVHVERYAGIVRRLGIRRRLITAAARIAGLAYDDSIELDDALTECQGLLAGVQSGAGGLELYSPEQQRDLMQDYLVGLGEGKKPGIPTGFPALDWRTGGLRPGGLYVLGAPTKMGKSAWLQTVGRFLRSRGYHGLLASSEMGRIELAKRDLSAVLGRDWNEIEREAAADQVVFARLMEDSGKLVQVSSYVYSKGTMTTDSIRRRALRLKAEGRLDYVIVDYLQRLSDPASRNQTREQQVTQIARSLKSLAVDLDVPVVVAAQFSRACIYREHKEPLLSDFRESGGVEQEGDVLLGLYRKSWFPGGDPNDTEAWLHILGNRHGESNRRIRLVWRPSVAEYGEVTCQ